MELSIYEYMKVEKTELNFISYIIKNFGLKYMCEK